MLSQSLEHAFDHTVALAGMAGFISRVDPVEVLSGSRIERLQIVRVSCTS